MVEFALIFPILITCLFIAIDFGYYIYLWTSVQFSARRGAEQASQMQPREVRLPDSYRTDVDYMGKDPCLRQIMSEAGRNGGTGEARVTPSNVYLSFHSTTTDNTPDTDAAAKSLGRIAQVKVIKDVKPLTPLSQWFLGGRNFRVAAVSRRSIVATGPTYPMVIEGNDYNQCRNN
jgi:Flp pilus assembly protein TadG